MGVVRDPPKLTPAPLVQDATLPDCDGRPIIAGHPSEAAMKLEGSCCCRAVKFTFASHTPYPFMRCYCSICRKTDGGGGYAINIMGKADTLRVQGQRHVRVYRAR